MNPKNRRSKWLHWLLPFVCSIVLVINTPDALAQTATLSDSISLPSPVELEYVVRVKYTAMSIGGRSSIKWDHNGKEYTIKTHARCNMLGEILKTSSKGEVGEKYLKPLVFTEKRRNRDETEVIFDYQNQTLTFSETKQSLPFAEGIQDRSSIVWQLAAYAKANPDKFVSGNKLSIKVAGRKRIDQWDVEIGETSTILTNLGDMKTVYFIRTDAKGKTTEVWLAPDMDWYPVKLIFSDNKDLRLEQFIKKVTKK